MRVLQRGIVVAAVATVMLNAGPAFAPFHIMVIEEVFFGTKDCPNAQYVMLRTRAGGMNFVQNQDIANQDASGDPAGEFGTFGPVRPPNGANGVAIIMGTAEAQALFGLTMDHVTSGRLVQPDGRVCFGDFGGPVDCVAYGSFTGANPGGGSPTLAPVLGMALVRASDAGNDADDFDVAPAMPENNAGEMGTLGTQCSALPSPTPTPTSGPGSPTPTVPPLDFCPGDCNDNNVVAINELVIGVNIVLETQPVTECPEMDLNKDNQVRINELVSAVNSILEECPDRPTPALGLPGTRRFSINPNASPFTAVVRDFGEFPSGSFQGYLDLRAGVADANGITTVDIVGSSEYIFAEVQPGLVICIKPRSDLFPIIAAGAMDCDGESTFGFGVTQDHNVGVVGQCVGGDNAGDKCANDDDCPESNCFAAEDCSGPGMLLEGDDAPHTGVCRGVLVPTTVTDDSGPGALVIAQTSPPLFPLQGLPTILTMEVAVPCGDEEVPAPETTFAFTTGTARAEVLDFNNEQGETFADEFSGENFSCENWQEEDGPGTFVLTIPTFDVDLPILGLNDIISLFTLAD